MKRALAWQVSGSALEPLKTTGIDLEKRLEDWMESAISVVADDLLVISRQQGTAYGKTLDLLAIDSVGDLAVIELKKDRSLRETVAQAIEYAAWCSELEYDEIVQIASTKAGGVEQFQHAYIEKFQHPLPETLNQRQKIYIVAPEITDFTASGIRYLAERFGVPINGVSFDLFGLDGKTILVSHVVVDEEPPAVTRATKRRPATTLDEFKALAEQRGRGEMLEEFLELLNSFNHSLQVESISFRAKAPDGRYLGAFSIFPAGSNQDDSFLIHISPPEQWSILFEKDAEECRRVITEIQEKGNVQKPWWENWTLVEVPSREAAANMAAVIREVVRAATVGKQQNATAPSLLVNRTHTKS